MTTRALLTFLALLGVAACTLSRSGSLEQTCSADADCNDGSLCTSDVCNPEGLCAHAAVDASAALVQVPYDCRRLVCDNGREVAIADDGDLPVESCIVSVCSESELHQSNKPDGTFCTEGQGTGTCEGGDCIIVCDPTDPASVEKCDDGNPCTEDACDAVSKICVRDELDNVESPLPDPKGNCLIDLCVGGMLLPDQVDDEDLPLDAKPCTRDLCQGGVPLNEPLDPGTGCGNNGQAPPVCNATGDCVDCNVPSDCAGQDTFCQVRTCIAEMCGVMNTANNTPLPQSQQNAGPCKEVQCDGNGGTKIVDRPNGTACDDGTFCNGADTCLGGNCSQHPGNPCPGPDGDGDCSESCSESNDNCTAADQNGTACTDGAYCNGTDTCGGGNCSVHSGNPCPGPDGDDDCTESCDEPTDTCTAADQNGSACSDAVFCNGTDTCTGGVCSTHAGNPCPGPDGDGNCSESCNETNDNCTLADPNGSACTDGSFCTGTETCTGGTCANSTGNPCPGHNVGPLCNDSCNELNDTCTASDQLGTSCNDGQFCTAVDTCNLLGSCVGAGNPCPGHNVGPLCNDSCSESLDNCTANDVNATSCSDGTFCNGAETCTAGACNSSGNPCSGHNVGPLCNDSCSESLDNCTANDADGTSCGQVQVCSMGTCASGCGFDLFPPGGICPIGCDSCDLANHICIIDCNAANDCQSMTIGCATGWACQVNCTGSAACQGATLACPSLYACDVACTANGACKDLVVNCPTEGTCNLSCPTGNGNTCNGAVLGCTSSLNECVATCAVGGPVTANCGSTPTCACSGCP